MIAQNEVNVQGELANKTCTRHNMNFHGCEKQIFESFGFTKIRKDPK